MADVFNFFSMTVFNFFLPAIWISSDDIKVKEIVIIFFSTLPKNVWNMLGLNCINYFLTIFPFMSSFQRFLSLPDSI